MAKKLDDTESLSTQAANDLSEKEKIIQEQEKLIEEKEKEGTVMLIEMPRFYVGKLLLHHYKSDLAHTSDKCSSVIEHSFSEIRAKNN